MKKKYREETSLSSKERRSDVLLGPFPLPIHQRKKEHKGKGCTERGGVWGKRRGTQRGRWVAEEGMGGRRVRTGKEKREKRRKGLGKERKKNEKLRRREEGTENEGKKKTKYNS